MTTEYDRRKERLQHNEVRFRELNARIVERIDELDADTGPLVLLCECAMAECAEMLTLTPEQYTHVRSKPDWFFVAPEHVVVDIEDVVERNDAHWVVQKT